MNFKLWNNITGWLTFVIAMTVYYFSVESTGSLWDCGEFIAGAYKLQVVHPPGAPLFLLIGRMFTLVAEMFSSDKASIAVAVNIMSAACTALAAMFICWTTVILAKLCLVNRESDMDSGQTIAALGAGLVAGLSSAFITSNWFSAVEGEVYAMSTFFTALVIWAIVKWYNLSDEPKNDRWLIFAIYASALSIGVHLLSLLTFPALALFYYFKKYKSPTIPGIIIAGVSGVLLVILMQKMVVTGIPELWSALELFVVNKLGMPVFSGLLPLIAIIGSVIFFGLRAVNNVSTTPALRTVVGILAGAALWSMLGGILGILVGLGVGIFAGYSYNAVNNALVQKALVALTVSIIGYSTVGVVLIRSNANTPINMNEPSDPLRLLPYLNREQYGDRPLLRGPNFNFKDYNSTEEIRYSNVDGKYLPSDRKIDYEFPSSEKVLFPRMGDQSRSQAYMTWFGFDVNNPNPTIRQREVAKGSARKYTMADNVSFFLRYQIGWMYWRYFMWNFVGRQNGEQGYTPANIADGNWLSGISALDENRLYEENQMTEAMRGDLARNTYYFLPLIFGLLGFIYHLSRRREDFLALLGLFVITGVGIIVYTNQTPMEPRERDYVLVGSFFTFCVWIGLGIVGIYDKLSKMASGNIVAPAALALGLSVPYILCSQNFDDHSRRGHTAARDYATNFLNSCKPNAIIFTYGDNDTYPLWYAQEVENIRTDVRVVNLSLIAVDWYINQLRRKVNESAPIKLTIPEASYRGYQRLQNFVDMGGAEMDLQQCIKFMGDKHPHPKYRGESYMPSGTLSLNVDLEKMKANGLISAQDTGLVNSIKFRLPLTPENPAIIKDDLAILDLIASNINERPIYFAVTCQEEKMQGLQNYMQLEGLGLRIIPQRNAGENRSFGIIGSGKVGTEECLDIFLNKFKFGNFNKEKTYINRSYQPSVQSMRFVMLRAARALIAEGKKDKAVAVMDKYFEGFPNNNFPYEGSTIFLIDTYIEAGAYDKAKPHIQILAQNTLEKLKFFESIGIKASPAYGFDKEDSERTMASLMQTVKDAKDEAYFKEMVETFGAYGAQDVEKQLNDRAKMQLLN